MYPSELDLKKLGQKHHLPNGDSSRSITSQDLLVSQFLIHLIRSMLILYHPMA